MRILHTSDWHLGRTLHGVDLLDHQAAYLDHLVGVVRAEAVDAVVVAGDVYDRAVPPVPAVALLAEALTRLSEITHVVVTPGNHDSATRLGFAAALLTERVRVRCRVSEVGRPVVLPGPDGHVGAYVYPLPYLDPETARHQLAPSDDEASDRVTGGTPEADDGARVVPARSHEAVVAAAMGRVRADLAERRRSDSSRVPALVMAHAFVVGGRASESERDIRVGGVDSVPAGVFAPSAANDPGQVDYVALGHLHGPQRVGRDLGGPVLRYAGSPLAYSFSEAAHHKSSALVEIEPTGATNVALVPAPVPRPLADVAGNLEELRGRAFEDRVSSWVRVTVTDPVRPPDLYAAVTARFPHALVIQHRPAQECAPRHAPEVGNAHDPVEIAAQFCLDVGGRAPTERERAILRESYEGALASGRSA